MLPQVLTTIIITALTSQANCVPVKRSIFDIALFDVRFSPNIQVGNPNARRTHYPLFPVPDIQAPFQFGSNIFNKNNNNNIPRRYYDTSENSLNGRVQMKYNMYTNFNQANVERGKDHTFKVTTVTTATTTLLAKDEINSAGVFNDNEIFTTPNTDRVTNDSTGTTESTTEYEITTTEYDLLNRMAIPPSVLASLAG